MHGVGFTSAGWDPPATPDTPPPPAPGKYQLVSINWVRLLNRFAFGLCAYTPQLPTPDASTGSKPPASKHAAHGPHGPACLKSHLAAPVTGDPGEAVPAAGGLYCTVMRCLCVADIAAKDGDLPCTQNRTDLRCAVPLSATAADGQCPPALQLLVRSRPAAAPPPAAPPKHLPYYRIYTHTPYPKQRAP